ncbi:hypothetical protein NT2_05_04300 [Caenibius tardaugens NBRC 16725]|uniref:SnoaL-like domain-containing protein n=1 Tax=Caenibius tardaugens NBRC 16725 TaxID=1219035 RepID=U2ZVV7_9SPHN|nr:nuclear transport factor 2 family protein [Caenibius tardaugens]AZI36829.1 nuclear transport factor 2 family protein [Caenibius tardaugens NBRC 16725]GAD49509.1 hypothetical protein NT2_05_04300 [Caenibius tardaugens NBRC 16725]
MPVTLEDLAARLTALEDIDAIRQLKARYLRCCDLKQVDELRETFLPGPIRIAYQNFPVFTDRDDFLKVYQEMACQGGVYDIHHATNGEITLTGTDRATGKWSLNFRTILLANRSVTRLGVEYEDVYHKRDGRWYIAETLSYVTSMVTEVIGEDGSPKYVAFGAAPVAA